MKTALVLLVSLVLTTAAAQTAGRAFHGGKVLATFFSTALSISQPSIRHGSETREKPSFAPEGEPMKTTLLLLSTLLLAESAQNAAAQQTLPPNHASAAFARLKTLAGEWQAETKEGKARISYELAAGGSALLERENMEGMPPMLTVYYLDGDRLLLTHYCMAGNQPRMQEQRFNSDTGEIEFAFLDATNLPNPAVGHMHNAKLRIIDHDHLVSEWQFYQDGKQKFVETAQYTRVQ